MNQFKYREVTKKDALNVREFCLRIIKEVYGYDYRPDWHADLDSLLNDNGKYSAEQKSTFLVAYDNEVIVGTIGIKSLTTKPMLLNKFEHFSNRQDIGSIWRAYVDKEYRGKGIGTKLVIMAEKFARNNGYQIMYLHTSKLNPDAITFWQKRDYKITLEENDPDQTIHMEKELT